MTANGVAILLNELTDKQINIQELYLSGSHFEDSLMKPLGEFIQNSKTIKLVDVGQNDISNKGIEILVPYIKDNIILKSLNLSNNPGINDESIPLLLNIINSSDIEQIDIAETFITQEKALLAPLVENILKKGLGNLNLERA